MPGRGAVVRLCLGRLIGLVVEAAEIDMSVGQRGVQLEGMLIGVPRLLR